MHNTFPIFFKARSAKSDYACPDGEIAGSLNLTTTGSNGSASSGITGEAPGFTCGQLRKPPLPEPEFTLERSVVDGWHIHPDMLPSIIADAPESKDIPSEAEWGAAAMTALSKFESDARSRSLFTQPFFVLAAYRLHDGSHICPSPPMLMIPNSGAPVVEGSSDLSVPTMKMSVVEAACRLRWRIKTDALPDDWSSVISHLDIFISEPIPLYKPEGDMKGIHRMECANFSHSVNPSGVAGEHRVYSSAITQGWKAEAVDEATVSLQIITTDSFRLISEVAVAALSTAAEFRDADFNRGGLAILSSLETYKPDFLHLSETTAEGMALISGRKTAWGLTVTPPAPYPLRLAAPPSSDSSFIPRWVFHPYPDARNYFFSAGGRHFSLPLRRHPSMQGAFFYRGMGATDPSQFEVAQIPASAASPDSVTLPGAIWRSGRSDSFLFPDSLLMHLDAGGVIAACRAFRASGLVATAAPTLYAFTSQGVFLLKEMNDGSLRDAGLICGYRLRDADSLTLLPTGVRFITDSGLTVTIEGTKVNCNGGDVAAVAAEAPWKDFIPDGWRTGGDAFSEGSEWGVMVTRPLKLGEPESWKRISGLALRGTIDDSDVALALYGSPDLHSWRKIAAADRRRIGGLWAPPCRFFRIAVKVKASAAADIEGCAIYAYTDSLTNLAKTK